MAYFDDANLGFPAEVNGASQTGYQDVYYPVVSPVYVPESQLYSVVHAVEYNGTTYFFQDLIDFPIYRLYNVITYTPANVVEENSSYGYLQTETVHSENVEQESENIPEYNYQPSAVEISSAESNEAISPSEYIDNFDSPGNDFNTINCENSWNTTYYQLPYGVNDQTSNIRENRVIKYSGVCENRSLESMVMRSELNLRFDYMNFRWPSVSNGCCLNDGPCQEVNNENSVVEFNNENIENRRLTEEVLHSNLVTEELKKFCRGKSVQVMENLEVTEKINDKYKRAVSNNENVLRVKKIDSVIQENIFTKGSQKLYRIKSIQEFNRISVTELVAEECVVNSINKNILKREHRIVTTDVRTVKGKELNIRGSLQGFQRMPVIEEVADKDWAIASCSKNVIKRECRLLKTDVCTVKAEQLQIKESTQGLQRMPVIEEVADEVCVVPSCSKNTLEKESSFIKSLIYTNRAKELYRKEKVQVFEKMPVIEEIPDEECVVESCCKNTLQKERPFVKSDIFTKRATESYRRENVQAFEKMPVIEEVPEEECPKESYRNDEYKDRDKIYNAFLDNNRPIDKQLSPKKDVILKRNINTMEKVKSNDDVVSETIITDKSPMVNVQGFSAGNVKDNKRERKSAAEKNTYEGTSLNPLNKDLYQNNSLETDIAFQNGNETAALSQKPKKKRFQNVRKFFGRLLRCCSKGPT